MNVKSFAYGGVLGMLVVAALGQVSVTAENKQASTPIGIPPETVAAYVHAVIQADRATYTTQIVERMQMRGIVVASENWEQRGTLPLPVQFLNESARLVAENQKGVSFRLISLWPINQRNGPANDFEREGLQDVLRQGDRPHTGIITKGGVRYFQAVFADRAISQSCVGCHNAHSGSPKTDFKLNDVMGGVVITLPL
jgi:Protein of unknown function (DUF3365)